MAHSTKLKVRIDAKNRTLTFFTADSSLPVAEQWHALHDPLLRRRAIRYADKVGLSQDTAGIRETGFVFFNTRGDNIPCNLTTDVVRIEVNFILDAVGVI